jgi:hypothetical protein
MVWLAHVSGACAPGAVTTARARVVARPSDRLGGAATTAIEPVDFEEHARQGGGVRCSMMGSGDGGAEK